MLIPVIDVASFPIPSESGSSDAPAPTSAPATDSGAESSGADGAGAGAGDAEPASSSSPPSGVRPDSQVSSDSDPLTHTVLRFGITGPVLLENASPEHRPLLHRVYVANTPQPHNTTTLADRYGPL